METNDKPIIEMNHVRKSFGPVKVLRDFSLSVPANQKLVILGPSGSGKSTVLRILMTLEDISSGDITIDGEKLWTTSGGKATRAQGERFRSIRGKAGMVFQHFNLFPHMTALRNVTEAPVRVRGMRADEAREMGMELLDKVGLKDKAGSHPAQLSGGQKQRVAIARALAMQPRIMLFDEVTSALDPELVGEVLTVLKDLASEGNMTMLFVTHHVDFAREIADRIVFMEHGRILDDNTPEEITSGEHGGRVREFIDAVIYNTPMKEDDVEDDD